MKYCPNCGTPAEDLQAFCINCGCKLPDKTGTGNSRPGGSNQTNARNRANTGNQASGSDQTDAGRRGDVDDHPNADYRSDFDSRGPGHNRWGGAASGQSRRKGLAMGAAIGAFAAVAAFILFFRGGGQDKNTAAPERQEASADSSEAAGQVSGPGMESGTVGGSVLGEDSGVDSQTDQTAGSEEAEKIPLKQGVTEGNNTFVHEAGKLVFFPHENALWSALIAEDGSLYDFCQDAVFADKVRSVAIIGTDLIVGTKDILYRTDMNSYQSGSGKLEEITDDGIDEFSVYEGYVYYKFGYSIYRVPIQGGEPVKLADNAGDYEVTNQGLFISSQEGEVYWLSYDGGDKKRLFDANGKKAYLSAGEDCIYVRYDGSGEVKRYMVSTQEQTSLSLAGWTGEYASIYSIWEAAGGLAYQGADNVAYRYDLASGSESRIGEKFSLPPLDVAFYGNTGYWSLAEGVHWGDVVSGITGSYEPEKDGGPGGGDVGGSQASGVGAVVETDLFQVTVPESWVDKVTYQIYRRDDQEYTVAFYQKSGQEAQTGGHLFSISLYMEGSEELEYLPSIETLGRLIYRPAEVYVVAAEYPTDVQFTAEGEAEYRALQDDVESILDTLTVDSAYEFQKS